MKLRTGEPFMAAGEYGRSLKKGISVNLLVADIDVSIAFQTEVLGVEVVYRDPDFAVMKFAETEWILHADHTYLDHPMSGIVGGLEARGAGAELRLHGCDPDTAEAKARARGDIVLAGAMDKPHGLHEAFLIDPDGYVWVPDVPLPRE